MTEENKIQNAVVNIKIIGIGGAGNNVLKHLTVKKRDCIELIALNSDLHQLRTLDHNLVNIIPLGDDFTRGLGCGGHVDLGKKAVQDKRELLKKNLQGTDLLFITAGMGGGFGTGAIAVVAEIAKEMGILTVCVVTMPFSFEGSRKRKTAQQGIDALRENVDAVLIIYNDNLLKEDLGLGKITMLNAFQMVDNVVQQAINCIYELILTVGVVNVDFADVRSILRQSKNSDALFGIGEADNLLQAVEKAINSPLLDRPILGAQGIILNITSNKDLSLFDITEATDFLLENTNPDNMNPDANIIFGTVLDETMQDTVRVTLIATDFSEIVHHGNDKRIAPKQFLIKNSEAEKKVTSSERPMPSIPSFMVKRQ